MSQPLQISQRDFVFCQCDERYRVNVHRGEQAEASTNMKLQRAHVGKSLRIRAKVVAIVLRWSTGLLHMRPTTRLVSLVHWLGAVSDEPQMLPVVVQLAVVAHATLPWHCSVSSVPLQNFNFGVIY